MMFQPASFQRRGIALVLVVGLLTLLLVAGAGMTALAARLRQAASLRTDAAAARLLARSGVDYAAARLFNDSRAPAIPTLENQSDDWTFRDDPGVSLDASRNPSYSQAEPYVDGGVSNGRYDPGIETYTDLNGNGRFDAGSGRLRGRLGSRGGRFLLRIRGEGDAISVNGGILEAGNRNAPPDWVPPPGDPVPINRSQDYQDVEPRTYGVGNYSDFAHETQHRNRRLSLILDGLGQILGVSTADPDPEVSGMGMGISFLGERIIGTRPLGGYRSIEEIRSRLSPADWRRVQPCLSLAASEQVVHSSWKQGISPKDGLGSDVRQMMRLDSISRPVLQALIYNLRFDGVAPHWFRLDESGRLADYLMGSCPFASHYDLFLRLLNEGAAAAPTLASQAEAGGSAWFDVLAANFNPDSIGGTLEGYRYPPRAWLTYDLARTDTSSLDRKVNRIAHKLMMRRNDRPPPAVGNIPLPGNRSGTLELSLLPQDTGFSVESLGRVESRKGMSALALVTASVAGGEAVSARTQAEFENLEGASRIRSCGVIGRPQRRRTQTEPVFSLDSAPDMSDHAGLFHYSRYFGTVRLMDRSGYRQGERFYLPGWEKGQPLRVPEEPVSFAENFRDIGGSNPAYTPLWIWDQYASPQVPAPLHEGVLTAERMFATGASPATLCSGLYTWDDKPFPLFTAGGAVEAATASFWSTGMPAGGATQDGVILLYAGKDGNYRYRPRDELFGLSGKFNCAVWRTSGATSADEQVSDPVGVTIGDWHHTAWTFDAAAQKLQGYIDGLPSPFLAGDWWSGAGNPARPAVCDLGFTSLGTHTVDHRYASEIDEVRLFGGVLDPSTIQGHASQPRFWTPDPDFPEVPSFTSPLYVPGGPVMPVGGRWDGLASNRLRDAADDWNDEHPDPKDRTVPIRLELVGYGNTDGTGRETILAFPQDGWRIGGSPADWRANPAARPIRSFRWRVFMDASAVGGFNPETPVLDAVTIAYRFGGRLRSYWEE